jgi:hypothetical protein
MMDPGGRRSRPIARQTLHRPAGGRHALPTDFDRAIRLLVRAAYDASDEPTVSEDFVARVLLARRGSHAEWINGLVASPLLALSIGI